MQRFQSDRGAQFIHVFRVGEFPGTSTPVATIIDPLRAELPAEQRDNLFEVLLAYVASDLFVLREASKP